MEKLTSMLAVIDRIEAAASLIDKSVSLARRFQSRITVQLRDPAHARTVAALCSQSNYPDIHLSVDRRAHQPLAEVIDAAVRDVGADLVVKAPRSAHPMGRAILQATDRRVAARCPVPLMLMRPTPWSPMMRFAAAVDVRESSHPALARTVLHTAGFLALGCHGELDVIYSETERFDQRVRVERAVRLAQLAREFHIDCQRLRMLSGAPEQSVTAFGAKGAYDALVLGALTQRTGLPAMFASLTSQLVDAFNCDVVLVKEAEASFGEQRLDEAH
jgi:nucleotide-binding universal stress UspA family protein